MIYWRTGCASCATFLFLPHFDVICDLLLNRRTATWNLFVTLISSHWKWQLHQAENDKLIATINSSVLNPRLQYMASFLFIALFFRYPLGSLRSSLFRSLLAVESESQGKVARRHIFFCSLCCLRETPICLKGNGRLLLRWVDLINSTNVRAA